MADIYTQLIQANNLANDDSSSAFDTSWLDKPSEQEQPKAEQDVLEPKPLFISGQEPQAQEPQAQEPQTQEPQTQKLQTQEPQAQEPQTQKLQTQEPQAQEPQTQEPQAQEPQAQEPQAPAETVVEQATVNDQVNAAPSFQEAYNMEHIIDDAYADTQEITKDPEKMAKVHEMMANYHPAGSVVSTIKFPKDIENTPKEPEAQWDNAETGENRLMATSLGDAFFLITRGNFTDYDARYQEGEAEAAIHNGLIDHAEYIAKALGIHEASKMYRQKREIDRRIYLQQNPGKEAEFDVQYPVNPEMTKEFMDTAMTMAARKFQEIKENAQKYPGSRLTHFLDTHTVATLSEATLGIWDPLNTREPTVPERIAGAGIGAWATAGTSRLIPVLRDIPLVSDIFGANVSKTRFAAEMAGMTTVETTVVDPIFKHLEEKEPYNAEWYRWMHIGASLTTGIATAHAIGKAAEVGRYIYADPSLAHLNLGTYLNNHLVAVEASLATRGPIARHSTLRDWMLRHAMSTPGLTNAARRDLEHAYLMQEKELSAFYEDELKRFPKGEGHPNITKIREDIIRPQLRGFKDQFINADKRKVADLKYKALTKVVNNLEKKGYGGLLSEEGEIQHEAFKRALNRAIKREFKNVPELADYSDELYELYQASQFPTATSIRELSEMLADQDVENLYLALEDQLTKSYMVEQLRPVFKEVEIDRVLNREYTIAKQLYAKKFDPNLFPDLEPANFPELKKFVDDWNPEAFGDFLIKGKQELRKHAEKLVETERTKQAKIIKSVGLTREGELVINPGKDTVIASRPMTSELSDTLRQLVYMDKAYMKGLPVVPKNAVRSPSMFSGRALRTPHEVRQSLSRAYNRANMIKGRVHQFPIQDELRLGELFDVASSGPKSKNRTFTTWSYDQGIDLTNKIRNIPYGRRASLDFSKVKAGEFKPGVSANPEVPKLNQSKALKWILEHQTTKSGAPLPSEIQKAVEIYKKGTVKGFQVPDAIKQNPAKAKAFKNIMNYLESQRAVNTLDYKTIENQVLALIESAELSPEELEMAKSILTKVNMVTPIKGVKAKSAKDLGLSESEKDFLVSHFEGPEVTPEQMIKTLEKMGTQDPKYAEIASDIKKAQFKGEIQNQAPEQQKKLRDAVQKITDFYAHEFAAPEFSKEQQELFDKLINIKEKGAKAQIYQAVAKSKLSKEEKDTMRMYLDFWYNAAKKSPLLATRDYNAFVLSKVQDLGLRKGGALSDLPRFLKTYFSRKDRQELLDTLKTVAKDLKPSGDFIENPAERAFNKTTVEQLDALVQEKIRQSASDPKNALKEWKAMRKQFMKDVAEGMPSNLPEPNVAPYIKTVYTEEELAQNNQAMQEALRDPKTPIAKQILSYDRKNPQFFSPEVNEMMDKHQAYRRALEKTLQNYTGWDKSLDKLISHPGMQKTLKVDRMIKQESANLAGTQFEQGIRYLRLGFLDKLRGTKELDNLTALTHRMQQNQFLDALRARMGTPVDLDSFTNEELRDHIIEKLSKDIAEADISDQGVIDSLGEVAVVTDPLTGLRETYVPENIKRALGYSDPDLIDVQRATATEIAESSKTPSLQVRVTRVMNKLLDDTVDTSSMAISDIIARRTTDPLFMEVLDPEEILEISKNMVVSEKEQFLAMPKVKKALGLTKISPGLTENQVSRLYKLYQGVEGKNLKRFKKYLKSKESTAFFKPGDISSSRIDTITDNAIGLAVIRRGILVQQAIRETLENGRVSARTLKNLNRYSVKLTSPTAAYKSMTKILSEEFASVKRNLDRLYTAPHSQMVTTQYLSSWQHEVEMEDAMIRQILNAKGTRPRDFTNMRRAISRYAQAVQETIEHQAVNRIGEMPGYVSRDLPEQTFSDSRATRSSKLKPAQVLIHEGELKAAIAHKKAKIRGAR